MREIKFRAWDKFNGCYWYSSKYSNLAAFFSEMQEFIDGDNKLIFEQYIDLKDKNGKEIYEGDLIELCNLATCPHEVYFEEWSCAYRLRANGEMQYDKTMMINFAKHGKVIGNIYENPDLLVDNTT